MWGGLHTEGGLIVRQMRDQGMKTVMISGDGITDNEFAPIGGPGVEGTLMTFGPDPRNNPAAKDVVAEFKAKNFDPEAYTLYSYAGVQIIKQAAEKAKSLDPKKVAEVMHSGMPFQTVIGDIAYDKKGDRTSVDYRLVRLEEGAPTARSPTSRCDLVPSPRSRGEGSFRRDPPATAGFSFFGHSRLTAGPTGNPLVASSAPRAWKSGSALAPARNDEVAKLARIFPSALSVL